MKKTFRKIAVLSIISSMVCSFSTAFAFPLRDSLKAAFSGGIRDISRLDEEDAEFISTLVCLYDTETYETFGMTEEVKDEEILRQFGEWTADFWLCSSPSAPYSEIKFSVIDSILEAGFKMSKEERDNYYGELNHYVAGYHRSIASENEIDPHNYMLWRLGVYESPFLNLKRPPVPKLKLPNKFNILHK